MPSTQPCQSFELDGVGFLFELLLVGSLNIPLRGGGGRTDPKFREKGVMWIDYVAVSSGILFAT